MVAGYDSGIVLGALKINGDIELIWVKWIYDPETDFETLRQEFGADFEEWVKESAEQNIAIVKQEPFELEATTETGHQMVILCYSITAEGETYYRRTAFWYCDTSQRIYMFDLTTIEEDNQSTL